MQSRIESFCRMIGFLLLDDIESILEVGCGSGSNLDTLSKMRGTIVIPRREIKYKLFGIDSSDYLIREAREIHRNIAVFRYAEYSHLPFLDASFDCVISAGTLGHIELDNLPAVVEELIRVSSKYILVIDHYSFIEEKVSSGWSRDYSILFADMQCIDAGFWDEEDGWDNQTWWLFKKREPPFKVEFL